MWKFDSPIGTLYIKELEDGKFGLLYNDIIYETCDTAQDEANNVYMHSTGCSEWDSFNDTNTNTPRDLSEWDIIF